MGILNHFLLLITSVPMLYSVPLVTALDYKSYFRGLKHGMKLASQAHNIGSSISRSVDQRGLFDDIAHATKLVGHSFADLPNVDLKKADWGEVGKGVGSGLLDVAKTAGPAAA